MIRNGAPSWPENLHSDEVCFLCDAEPRGRAGLFPEQLFEAPSPLNEDNRHVYLVATERRTHLARPPKSSCQRYSVRALRGCQVPKQENVHGSCRSQCQNSAIFSKLFFSRSGRNSAIMQTPSRQFSIRGILQRQRVGMLRGPDDQHSGSPLRCISKCTVSLGNYNARAYVHMMCSSDVSLTKPRYQLNRVLEDIGIASGFV